MYTFDLSLLRCHFRDQSGEVIIAKEPLLLFGLNELESWIHDKCGLSKDSFYIVCNGKKISCSDIECNYDGIYHVIPKILGGKGGFGSMLRAIGAQIEKTTNREACRDLSGRRLRDINEEQRLKNWISQQADREREAAERKKKKLERLCQEPKHEFKDDKYDECRSEMSENMCSSIEQGFKASTSSASVTISVPEKRKNMDNRPKVPAKKKKNLWVDADDSDSSSSESTELEDKDVALCKN